MKLPPEQMSSLSVGDSLEVVKKRLNLSRAPEKLDDSETPYCYEFPKEGLSILFNRSKKVETLHFEAPFAGTVDGVAIGDSPKVVLKKKGKPNRKWPIADGIDRWLYEKGSFIRFDFSPMTGLVEHIWR